MQLTRFEPHGRMLSGGPRSSQARDLDAPIGTAAPRDPARRGWRCVRLHGRIADSCAALDAANRVRVASPIGIGARSAGGALYAYKHGVPGQMRSGAHATQIRHMSTSSRHHDSAPRAGDRRGSRGGRASAQRPCVGHESRRRRCRLRCARRPPLLASAASRLAALPGALVRRHRDVLRVRAGRAKHSPSMCSTIRAASGGTAWRRVRSLERESRARSPARPNGRSTSR